MKTVCVIVGIGFLPQIVCAQLVSVQCCTEQKDLEQIGFCISGPNDLNRPAECGPASTCILGFGADTLIMERLCDPDRLTQPEILRAYCSSWHDEGTQVVQECIAKPGAGVTLFEGYDDEQDGDLDLQDLRVFGEIYDHVPKIIQSEGIVVSVECCVPNADMLGIGLCLSGPDVRAQPSFCTANATCTVGFSQPVEIGDWLYKLCASAPGVIPDPANSFCVSWQDENAAIGFRCLGAPVAGNSLFVVADADGDADVDLFDYARLQLPSKSP